MTINDRIREDWGTVTFFCRKNNININTFKVVMHGNGTSSRIAKILIDQGYIKHADELKKAKASK